MTASTVSRVAQVNGAGDVDALRLKQFGGEILTEFEAATVFKSRHFIRQISNGNTAQFPLIGTVDALYHTPGSFIDGQAVNHAEHTIKVDGLLIAPLFVDRLDELMNHYDVRGPYATEMGRKLAYQFDQNVARMGVIASRSSNALSGRDGGGYTSDASMDTDAEKITAGLFTAAQKLDEKNVAEHDRWAFFRPAQYYLLARNEDLLDVDYGGSANISTGKILKVAGIDIIKTNHLPSADDTSNTDIHSKYRADFSNTVGLVMNRFAVGTVQLMDIAMESDWEPRRQGTFMLAKMAVGHDKLRPECAFELRKSSG